MFKRISAFLLALAISVTTVPATEVLVAEAKTKNEGTAELRIYSTSDLHGQSITYSYDTASAHPNGSLAQVVSVMKQDKKTIEHGTSLFVDCGDTIFGLGAKATMSKMVSADKQYMYEIMKELNYDAITLGNHDFDYGYSYEKKILESSGLDKKVVLANVSNAKTGKYPWATRRMIKKTLKTSKGIKKTIKIGVTGAVIPQLTTYTTWKGILSTEDIVESVRQQANLLKKEGADIVVVLAHSGIGDPKDTEEFTANVGYRLTKISNVDVICLGHTHVNYPSSDSNVAEVYSYSGVNSETGLINGKIVIQEADHGQALGISKLKFEFKNDKLYIKNKKTTLRKITAADKEDSKVVSINKPYDEIFRQMYDQVNLSSGGPYSNYFGMIEDNPLVQLANDAKIAHAQKVVAQKAPDYTKYPIVASTSYNLAGGSSALDYIHTDGGIGLKDILNLQKYGQEWSKFYYLTGAQLREALEWQASAYTNPQDAANLTWQDPRLNELVATDQMCPILSPEWENWEGLTIFDGVEYTIDASQPARYNKDGMLINPDAKRITKFTCNGRSISDSQIFVWVTRNIAPKFWPMLYDQVKDQMIVSKTELLTDVLEQYVVEQNKIGVDKFYSDHNWHVEFPEGDNYVIKSSDLSAEEAAAKSWYGSLLSQDNGYSYFRAGFGRKYEDKNGPLLSVSALETQISGEAVPVAVQCSDVSGVSSVLYTSGYCDEKSGKWAGASDVRNNRFAVEDNGIYSVMAKDSLGNVTVKYIFIENINMAMASTPKVNTVKNTHKAVSGTASSNSTVYVETATGVYETSTESDKTFSCPVEGLVADIKIYVWQKDSENRFSEKVEIVVQRGGANKPVIDNITNKKTAISGNLNDSSYCSIVAVRGSKVYIAKGTRYNYKQSKLYSKYRSKTIVETEYKINRTTKKFKLYVPDLYADQTIKVTSYDWIYRPSLVGTYHVEDVAPNRPILDDVVAQEGQVYGYIPQIKEGRSYGIKVVAGDEEFFGSADEEGYFAVKTETVDPGTKVTVKAFDYTDTGKKRVSLTDSAKAESCFDLYTKETVSHAQLEKIDNKSESISGLVKYGEQDKVSFIIGNNQVNITPDESGAFEYSFSTKKAAGTKIALLIRNNKGEVEAYNAFKVRLAKPDDPEFYTDEITEDTSRIKIGGVDDAKAVLQIGSRKYVYTKKVESTRGGEPYYYYIFKIKKLKKGKKVYAYLKNDSGSSKKVYCGKVAKGGDNE